MPGVPGICETPEVGGIDRSGADGNRGFLASWILEVARIGRTPGIGGIGADAGLADSLRWRYSPKPGILKSNGSLD